MPEKKALFLPRNKSLHFFCYGAEKGPYGHPLSIGIRDYIKNRTKLGQSSKLIYNEIVNKHGDNIVSYKTVSRWAKQFRDGGERLEIEPRSGRRINKTTKQKEAKIKKKTS